MADEYTVVWSGTLHRQGRAADLTTYTGQSSLGEFSRHWQRNEQRAANRKLLNWQKQAASRDAARVRSDRRRQKLRRAS